MTYRPMPWALCALLLSAGNTSLAQHAMHNMGTSGEIELHTMPADDAVLAAAPQQVMLHFGPEVRLVKLVLRNAGSELVDIGFRYEPVPGRDFVHALPALAGSDYYKVEWAVLDAAGTLIKGDFHFAFGANARPPSHWLDQMEQMRPIMAPDYRLLGPSPQ